MTWPGLVAQMDGAILSAMGIATSYKPITSPAITVAGIFDAAYVRVEVGEAGVSSSGPAVFYRLGTSSDVIDLDGTSCVLELPVDPEIDDPITIDGVTYGVIEVKKDGQGGVHLQLHKR